MSDTGSGPGSIADDPGIGRAGQRAPGERAGPGQFRAEIAEPRDGGGWPSPACPPHFRRGARRADLRVLGQPTALVVILIAVLLLVALGLIELIARPPAQGPAH